jgi:3-hydroxyisobutyrate dehydrogenase-like beta-hydroxyacid dehydrogenase
MWDTPIIDAIHSLWSATEWAVNIDYAKRNRAHRQRLQAGTPLDWMEETVELAQDVYANTPQKTPLTNSYAQRFTPMVEEQLLKSGYRLAKLLNEIFK